MADDALPGIPDPRGVTAVDGTAKARIERAALVLFAQHGVDAVSTREIASAAQVAEGSIYRHFKSKEVLAEALFEAIHSRLFDLVETALSEAVNFEDAVTRVVGVYCQAADEDPALFEYHLIHMFRFGRTDRAGRPDPVTLIAQAIARAMDNGDCPPGDPELKAAMALGLVLQPAAHRMAGRLTGLMTDNAPALAHAALAALKTD
ncbi:TetR/AcrR family transcriptional regulator [Oceanicaulis alexandrii]|uniref:TetR/AcrR family transcriptional regulator n=1 Tax=Oceanicaulis alexandrii TaxID=153233 RepID=UPI0003B7A1CE|nr:TetR/AcrR family transcriptional regulator [Oceanicaulis alexandrii]